MSASIRIFRCPYPSFQGSWRRRCFLTRNMPRAAWRSSFPYFGTSHYDAAQVVLTHRLNQGLSFLVSYAFQKTISLNDSSLYGYNNGSQDVYNRKLERSVASFDHPQQLKLTWIYEVPLRQGQALPQSRRRSESGLRRLDGDRDPDLSVRRSTLYRLRTRSQRLPVQRRHSRRCDSSGVPMRLPSGGTFDYAGGTGQAYLNPAAFAEPPTTPNGVVLSLGNTPRFFGNLRGPWQPMENLGFFKRFPFREGTYLEFRADLINAFNRCGTRRSGYQPE